MATMRLVNWNAHTTSSSQGTLKLTSERFAPLGGIRVSCPVPDGSKTSRKFRFVVRAGPKKGGNSGDKARRYDPMFARGGSTVECPVPWEQQPVNEYQMLNETGLFAWATDPLLSFGIRISAVTVGVSALVGYPIVSLSINAEQEFLKCCMGALCGGILAATVVTLRLYLGWAYIGNRLFSATVEYEETGWYDGEVWVKPPEVLARDRLLGSYKVKPALLRMKVTLVGLAISLLSLTGAIYALPGPPPHIEPAEDMAQTFNRTSKLTYSDSAARRYEPEAFAGEDDLSSVATPTLFDYCQ
ncbi:hypothetical protein M758_11G049900 [Ceratodon purpureus]|uniref:DUF1230 family protein n=1 Tax=Ceratodon purpureus TaxID=3225 RepID=A0A8T0IYR7_CERPU|nr:hypothetical protein KC19_11G051500 [Ceratodon purpureus]KAG0587866.1 hypothetical protein KC19_2G197500 [Ceratodon purpureus]KAG0600641.1 hypothetical protein M758_11G049900 [Ceratodon purpureus]